MAPINRHVLLSCWCSGKLKRRVGSIYCKVPTAEEAADSAAAASVRNGAPEEGMASSSSSSTGSHAESVAGSKPVKASMQKKLTEALQPDLYVLLLACCKCVVSWLVPFQHVLASCHLMKAGECACRLTIWDESNQHAGHAGSRMLASPSGETHFRVGIVSSAFSGLNTVKRHRLVYKVSCCRFEVLMHVPICIVRGRLVCKACYQLLLLGVQILEEELAGPVHALSLDTKAPEDVQG